MEYKKIVIFGASGDLTKKKILIALNNINIPNLEIILYCRSCTEITFKTYLDENKNFIKNIREKIIFVRGEYHDIKDLKGIVDKNTVFYLSIPPETHFVVIDQICKFNKGIVALEKPYGDTYEDFLELKEKILAKKHLDFFLVDHFLTKKVASDFKNIFLTNKRLFEIVNNKFVESCDIFAKETILAGGRRYFDKAGLVKDMLLNHMMEFFCLVASDPFSKQEESFEELLSSTKLIEDLCIFGQYEGYCEEFGYYSETETFAAVTLEVCSPKWEGVPFFVYSGKALDEKKVEISLKIKNCEIKNFCIVFEIPNDGIEEANIVFNIQTEARIYVSLKRAGVYEEIELYGDLYFKSENKLYDYENILYSLIMQEQFNHANSVEVEFFYKIFKNILDSEKKLVQYPQKYSFMKEIDQLRENYKNSR